MTYYYNYLNEIRDDPEDYVESQPFNERKKTDKDEKTKNLWKTILRSICIIFRSIIILTLTFLTYLGFYLVLNNITNPVQTVTVSSEGPAAEMYPDYMGQYNIFREVYRYDRAVYKHVNREDRFIIYTGKNISLTDLAMSNKVFLYPIARYFMICGYIFVKVNSGTSQMTCLPRMELSEALVKEACSFLRRDGNMLVHVERSGDKLINLIISSYQL